MSNDCALNLSQKRCFMMFCSVLFVYSYLCYADLSNCPLHCGIRVTPKANFHFMPLL